MTTVGVLSLQGDFAEHASMLQRSGAAAVQIRRSHELDSVDGLIIPGGESTAIARLTENNNDPIFGAIREYARLGMPVYGTCMGSIFLARQIEGSAQGRLALMDVTVRRNAFGPQRSSFEQFVDIPLFGSEPFPAVFIRAPLIVNCGPAVEVLSVNTAGILMARQDNLLVSVFHPEITNDTRVHRYFLDMVHDWRRGMSAGRAGEPRYADTAGGGIPALRELQLA